MSETEYYKEMLDIGKPFVPSNNDLNELAKFMARMENEPTPAGYTYLGQFIDHDITLAVLPNGETPDQFGEAIPLTSLENHRSPFLNLETIYGFPVSQHDEPSRDALKRPGSSSFLNLAPSIGAGLVKQPFPDMDLPRDGDRKAIIVDQRNDENLAVAQTHVMFVRFHNAVVNSLGNNPEAPGRFEEARKIVIQHYQWIVLHDYLRRVLKNTVLDEVLESTENLFYRPTNTNFPYIPLEFSTAAFRFGHSMIANTYNWNRIFNRDSSDKSVSPATLNDLMTFTYKGGFLGQPGLVSEWLINWTWFYEVSRNFQRQNLNLAEPIDTRLARLTTGNPDIPQSSLAARDLYRNRAHGLPTGQEVARTILGRDDLVLKPEQIDNLLPPHLRSKAAIGTKLALETPLWFYLLAEAEIEESGRTLGTVGSRIVAEVFVELIRLSEYSILKDGFLPEREWSDANRKFEMRNLLLFVANQKEENLNPLGR